MKLYEKGDFRGSIPFFESLRNRFPASPLAVKSELRVADALYENQDYGEAEVSYQTFRSLHPTHEKVPYVIFRSGMTHMKRTSRGIDRDQTHTQQAIEIFDGLIRKHPRAKEISEARKHVRRCRHFLAEREMYVADFYLKRNQYEAALHRLKILHSGSEFPDLNAEAGYKLGYAHYKLKNLQEARTVLQEVAKNPKAGAFRKKATNLLTRLENSRN